MLLKHGFLVAKKKPNIISYFDVNINIAFGEFETFQIQRKAEGLELNLKC